MTQPKPRIQRYHSPVAGRCARRNVLHFEALAQPPCLAEKLNTIRVVYWGYIGIMEKKVDTTVVYCNGL